MSGVEGARWQRDDQLHITLRYIGEVDQPMAQDVAAALARIAFAPFDVALSGLGAFARRGRLDALWAGVTPRDPMERLHRKIDHACVRCGLAPEGRAYLPHLTLARFGKVAGSPDEFLARHAGLASPPFAVEEFGLFESELGREGSTYHLVERYPARSF